MVSKGVPDPSSSSLPFASEGETYPPDYEDFVKPSQFITEKPVMYICNVDEGSAVSGNKYVDLVKEAVKDSVSKIVYQSLMDNAMLF